MYYLTCTFGVKVNVLFLYHTNSKLLLMSLEFEGSDNYYVEETAIYREIARNKVTYAKI